MSGSNLGVVQVCFMAESWESVEGVVSVRTAVLNIREMDLPPGSVKPVAQPGPSYAMRADGAGWHVMGTETNGVFVDIALCQSREMAELICRNLSAVVSHGL